VLHHLQLLVQLRQLLLHTAGLVAQLHLCRGMQPYKSSSISNQSVRQLYGTLIL
jgi:hypothetical protein